MGLDTAGLGLGRELFTARRIDVGLQASLEKLRRPVRTTFSARGRVAAIGDANVESRLRVAFADGRVATGAQTVPA